MSSRFINVLRLFAAIIATASPALAQDLQFSQYYEGGSLNKYIEIKNPTSQPINLKEYSLALYSGNSATPSSSENWKSETAQSVTNAVRLSTEDRFLQPDQFFLVSNAGADTPSYAVAATNLKSSNVINFNGDDSIVLYKATASPFARESVVDAICFTAGSPRPGDNLSFRRKTTGIGYSFQPLSTVTSFPAVWESTVTTGSGITDATNTVALAASGEDWRLEGQIGGVAPTLNSFVVAANAVESVSPKVLLTWTSSGDNPTEFMVSEDAAFAGAAWVPLASVSLATATLSPGAGLKTLYLKVKNGTGESSALSSTITFTPTQNPPSLLFTQYYEGPGNEKFLEITNVSNAAVNLANYRVVRWTNADNAKWAIAGIPPSGGSPSITFGATAPVLEPQMSILVGSSQSLRQSDADPLNNLGYASGDYNFNGDDTLALYNGTPGVGAIEDVLTFATIAEGAEKCFVRNTLDKGYDFITGASLPTFTSVWSEITLAVANEAPGGGTDPNHLGTYFTGVTGFDAWAGRSFSGSQDLAVIGFAADPDKDGVPNGVEHLLGTNPTAASGIYTQANYIAPGSLVVQHPLIRQTTDVLPVYRWSTDLAEWQTSALPNAKGEVVSISTSTVAVSPGASTLEVRAEVLFGTPTRVFLRLEAIK